MNNEHLSTAIIIYCPISSSLLALHSSFKTYTFATKERDEESGLSYFGARYYSSNLSIWLAVDPMSDKYPSLSPYVYCADNPIKLVDPNGEEVWLIGEYGWNNIIGFQASPLLGDNDNYNNIVDALLGNFSQDNFKKVIDGFKNYSGANRGGTYNNDYLPIRRNQSKHLIEDFYHLMPWKN